MDVRIADPLKHIIVDTNFRLKDMIHKMCTLRKRRTLVVKKNPVNEFL